MSNIIALYNDKTFICRACQQKKPIYKIEIVVRSPRGLFRDFNATQCENCLTKNMEILNNLDYSVMQPDIKPQRVFLEEDLIRKPEGLIFEYISVDSPWSVANHD